MFNNLLSSTYMVDTLEPYAIWVTVGLLGAIILFGAIIFFAKKELFKKIVKPLSIAFFFYALIVGIVMLVLELSKKYNLAYLEDKWVSFDVINMVFIPLLITLSLTLLSSITIFVLTKKKVACKKIVSIILTILCIASLVVTVILMSKYHAENIQGDGYYTADASGFNSVMLYVFAGVLAVLLVTVALTLGNKNKRPFDTKCIAMAGICVSLSFALSYVKLVDMPTGGSITLVSLLPLMLFSFVYGSKKGIFVAFLYGTLQAIQDPWLIHPAQFFLDYPIAFAMAGLAGIFTDLKLMKNRPQLNFALGALLGGVMRFVSHVLSGVFAFGAYAIDEGITNFWAYSSVYNLYVLIDISLVMVAGIILLSSNSFKKELCKLNPEQN